MVKTTDTLTLFFSAACLWFLSVDRETQIGMVEDFGGGVACRTAQGAQVVEWVGMQFRNLKFPLFRGCNVFGAAVFGFIALPDSERKEWVKELHIGPVGSESHRPRRGGA